MSLSSPIPIGNLWVNLYTAAGITVGAQVIVHVYAARSRVALSDTAAEPTDSDGKVSVELGQFYQNDAGDSGLWARCPTDAQIVLQEV